jgi:cation transport ATPase
MTAMEDAKERAKAILKLEIEKTALTAGEAEEKLEAIEGVLRVRVNYVTHRLHVWYDPTFLTIDELKRRIHDALQ